MDEEALRGAAARWRAAVRTSPAPPPPRRPAAPRWRARAARGRSAARPRCPASRRLDPRQRLAEDPLVVLVCEALANQALGDLGRQHAHLGAELRARASHFLAHLRLGRLKQPRGLLARLGAEPLAELRGLAQCPL